MYQPNKVLLPFVRRALLAALCGGAIGGCTTEPMKIPESLRTGASAEEAEAVPGNASSPGTGNGGSREAQGPAFGTTPRAGGSAQAGVVDKLDRVKLDDGKANVTVNVEDVTLAAFINEVFGNILGLSFEIDNNLKNKADRVTLRLEQPQTSQMVYNVASQVMANYGVEIVKQGDVLRFQIKQIGLSPDEPPILISGDARPDVPIAYRPVFQFVQLHNVDAKDVIPWLSSAYEKSGLTATADGARGGLMLKGMSSIVTQAAKAVELLDQPFMRGQYSLRIDPAFVSSETLAKQLKTLLVAQGYSVGLGEASGSIVLVPLESSNGLIVFANQQSLLRLVREWAEQADRAPAISAVEDGSGSAKEGLFFYEVRNTRATDLAKSLRSLMSGLGGGGAYGLTPDLSNSASKRAAVDSAVPNRPGSGDMGSTRNAGVSPLLQLAGTQALLGGAGNSGLMDSLASSMMGGGTLVEDENRNAILFRGPGRTWQQLQPMLKQLDRPARQVLIEVTIASVDLVDNRSFGIDWSFGTGDFSDLKEIGKKIELGPKGEFSYLINTAGGAHALLSAVAQNNRARILATPRVLVKSGQQANINVGSDIPVTTTRQNDGSSTDGTSNIIQGISYRSTGVILNVSPVVYSNNRVDLTVSQEVSSSGAGGSSGGSSDGSDSLTPTITRTSMETALTLQSGGSIFMGGLIRENGDDGKSGIPWLKDVPVLGYLFGKSSVNKSRSEVVMLIQPYIIEGADEARDVTERLRQMIEPELSCHKSPGACG
ncbi:secretin N-terminal domain-containing protein [Pseudomonas sp. MT3]